MLSVCFQVGALAGQLGCLLRLLKFVLLGGMVIELLQIASAAVVISGLSGRDQAR